MTNTQIKPNKADLLKQAAFDAFLFSATVGIWGFILSLMALKWVMP